MQQFTQTIKGRIHSIESMGLVDGPGIRAVVFMQGCRLRCRFCHNPDTWALHSDGGEALTPQQLLTRLLRFRPYFVRSGGGVTFSGGEPLLQPQFLLQILQLCRQNGLHTCIDTAGVGVAGQDYTEILQHCDLVLYDVKHWQPDAYQRLTGQPITETQTFLQALRSAGVPVWVRHVVMPGATDSDADMAALQAYITANITCVQKVELLPYHLLGKAKYAAMGLNDPLPDTPAMDKARCAALQQYFDDFCKNNSTPQA